MRGEKMRGEFRAGDDAAKLWFLLSLLWFPVFTAFGFILAIKFFSPDFLGGKAWLTFGRVRPAHVNGILFGFLSSGLIGGMLYTIPRLCRSPLRFPKLAKALALIWNATVLAGVILILLGYNQGREYAELPWVIDWLVLLGVILLGFVVISTIAKRAEEKLYVSLWYFTGTMLWFPVVYFVGNVMWRSNGALYGTLDAIFNWYYGHNVLGLWFTTLGVGLWYYAIPRMISKPLYSHLLSIISFFTIAFFYTGVGAHHLLQAPIPEWIKTIAVITSVLMLIPVLTFATNIFLTLRGSWQKIFEDIPLRFVVLGFIFYILTSLQGSFHSLRSVNMYIHFSQWTVAHAHLALLGSFGFLVIGLEYWLIPKLVGRRVFSPALMSLSFWLAFIGFSFFFLAMLIAGLVANAAWWQNIGVATALSMLRPFFIARAIGGGIVVLSAIITATNLLMTFFSKERYGEEESKVVEKLQHTPEKAQRTSKLSLPVIVAGGMAVFAIMTYMVVGMPYMFAAGEPSEAAHKYTGLEEKGRQLYISLGCFYCHSQFVRPQDWAIGRVASSGDYYYDSPHLLGTERTGPDLSRIGGKRPTKWHYIHLINPRSTSPQSIMPPFTFLNKKELDALVAYLQNLGGKDLEQKDFQPDVPEKYRNKSNPYMALMMKVKNSFVNGSYKGDEKLALEFARVFEEGKRIYTAKCLPCHGGSGNGQGSYARHLITRPANLHERLKNYPDPDDPFHFWRVSEGVPGTAMPAWKYSLTEDEIWKVNFYEMSFVDGALRTLDEEYSDKESLDYARKTKAKPSIKGTKEDFEEGRKLYLLYCAQCHGESGQGDGIASATSPEGYISPEPANLTEAGESLKYYGQYLWKVRRGVETTNMPPWGEVLSKEEIERVIFYIQSFSPKEVYRERWAPLYEDSFAREVGE